MATRGAAGLVLLGLSAFALGCGGAAKPVPQAPVSPQGEGASSEGEGSAGVQPDAPGAPLDENECTQLADHLVDLSLAAKRGKPAGTGASAGASGEVYTDEDAEAAKRELRQSLKPACATLPRRDFSCAMAARTSAELGACQK